MLEPPVCNGLPSLSGTVSQTHLHTAKTNSTKQENRRCVCAPVKACVDAQEEIGILCRDDSSFLEAGKEFYWMEISAIPCQGKKDFVVYQNLDSDT